MRKQKNPEFRAWEEKAETNSWFFHFATTASFISKRISLIRKPAPLPHTGGTSLNLLPTTENLLSWEMTAGVVSTHLNTRVQWHTWWESRSLWWWSQLSHHYGLAPDEPNVEYKSSPWQPELTADGHLIISSFSQSAHSDEFSWTFSYKCQKRNGNGGFVVVPATFIHRLEYLVWSKTSFLSFCHARFVLLRVVKVFFFFLLSSTT